MKKPMAALLGAVTLALVAVSLYRGRDWIVEREMGADRGLPPDPDVAVIQRTFEAKDQVADEVIAGRMTLVEAAAQFRAINASRPPHQPAFLPVYSGRSDEERIGRQVIFYVQHKLRNRPEEHAVVTRLEAELEKHLADSEPASLPNSPVARPARATD